MSGKVKIVLKAGKWGVILPPMSPKAVHGFYHKRAALLDTCRECAREAKRDQMKG